MSYKYLEKFLTAPAQDAHGNSFYKVHSDDILLLSKVAGFKTPKSLEFFWQSIGYGFLNTGCDGVSHIDYVNRFLHPREIRELIINPYESQSMLEDAVEMWEELAPDCFPFFEIADRYSFLMMKKNEPENSAVYDMGGSLIEPKFEDFIHNLYYKSPVYYLDKLED